MFDGEDWGRRLAERGFWRIRRGKLRILLRLLRFRRILWKLLAGYLEVAL